MYEVKIWFGASHANIKELPTIQKRAIRHNSFAKFNDHTSEYLPH